MGSHNSTAPLVEEPPLLTNAFASNKPTLLTHRRDAVLPDHFVKSTGANAANGNSQTLSGLFRRQADDNDAKRAWIPLAIADPACLAGSSAVPKPDTAVYPTFTPTSSVAVRSIDFYGVEASCECGHPMETDAEFCRICGEQRQPQADFSAIAEQFRPGDGEHMRGCKSVTMQRINGESSEALVVDRRRPALELARELALGADSAPVCTRSVTVTISDCVIEISPDGLVMPAQTNASAKAPPEDDGICKQQELLRSAPWVVGHTPNPAASEVEREDRGMLQCCCGAEFAHLVAVERLDAPRAR